MFNLITLYFVLNGIIGILYVIFILFYVMADARRGGSSPLQRTYMALAKWIWRNLSCGEMPFYDSPALQQYTAPIAPNPSDWRGWKLSLWRRAVMYLVRVGYLTSTPTLREKF